MLDLITKNNNDDKKWSEMTFKGYSFVSETLEVIALLLK